MTYIHALAARDVPCVLGTPGSEWTLSTSSVSASACGTIACSSSESDSEPEVEPEAEPEVEPEAEPEAEPDGVDTDDNASLMGSVTHDGHQTTELRKHDGQTTGLLSFAPRNDSKDSYHLSK